MSNISPEVRRRIRGRAGRTDVWLSVMEAAERAGVSSDTIRRAYIAGELRVSSIGDGIRSPKRFRPQWVDQWLESRAEGGSQQ